MDATLEDILTDRWAHYFFENPNVDEIEDEDFNLDNILQAIEEGDWEEVKFGSKN